MTGRYLIYTPLNSEPGYRGPVRSKNSDRFDKSWHKFAEVCRLLHRDGLSYDVQFNLTAAKPHVLITASGTAKPRRQAAHRATHLPPPVQAKHAAMRRQEVEWFLPENLSRRNNGTAYWQRQQSRYCELSVMAEDHLRAELEYWRELELLSGQREHFKPGRTDETVNADDEVAA